MKLRLVVIGVAVLTAATVAVGMQASYASTTYSPNGGANVDFVGSSVSFTDPNAAQTITCSTLNLAGSIVSPGGSRALGAAAIDLSAVTISGCMNPTVGPTTITPMGTWAMGFTGAPTGSVWPAELSNVAATVSGAHSAFTMAGTVTGTFNTSTQKFTPNANGTLAVTTVPTGVWWGQILGVDKGDPITLGGTWTNMPPSGSTALTLRQP